MSKNKAVEGAPKERPLDLSKSSIPIGAENPGGHRRPAGQAHWFSVSELSPRRNRELAKWEMVIMPKLVELAKARLITGPDGEVLAQDDALPGLPVGLTVEDTAAMLDLNTAAAWAYLKSWTLTYSNGSPVPMPETPDDLLDLDNILYESLIEHAAKIQKQKVQFQATTGDEFSADAFDAETAPSPAADGATAPIGA